MFQLSSCQSGVAATRDHGIVDLAQLMMGVADTEYDVLDASWRSGSFLLLCFILRTKYGADSGPAGVIGLCDCFSVRRHCICVCCRFW